MAGILKQRLFVILLGAAVVATSLARAEPMIPLTAEERAWLAENPVVRLGVDLAWPPFEWVDENGRHLGLTSDYIKRIEEITGLTFKRVPGLSWTQILEGLQNGTVDMNAALTYNPDREHYLNLTKP